MPLGGSVLIGCHCSWRKQSRKNSGVCSAGAPAAGHYVLSFRGHRHQEPGCSSVRTLCPALPGAWQPPWGSAEGSVLHTPSARAEECPCTTKLLWPRASCRSSAGHVRLGGGRSSRPLPCGPGKEPRPWHRGEQLLPGRASPFLPCQSAHLLPRKWAEGPRSARLDPGKGASRGLDGPRGLGSVLVIGHRQVALGPPGSALGAWAAAPTLTLHELPESPTSFPAVPCCAAPRLLWPLALPGPLLPQGRAMHQVCTLTSGHRLHPTVGLL